jgi:hypothetical protein
MATKLAGLSVVAIALAWGLAGAFYRAQAEPGFVRVLSHDDDSIHPIQQRRLDEAMSAGDLVTRLAARGYRDISAPRRKGSYYVVEAIGRRGERLTLIVDVWSGDISGLRRRID